MLLDSDDGDGRIATTTLVKILTSCVWWTQDWVGVRAEERRSTEFNDISRSDEDWQLRQTTQCTYDMPLSGEDLYKWN